MTCPATRAAAATVARVDSCEVPTDDERRGSNCLADRLQEAYTVALTPEARQSLDAVDRRVAVSRKGGP
jgi:hypothetical protein